MSIGISNRNHIDQILAEAIRKSAALDAERAAQRQAWWQNASPAEKMPHLIRERSRTDAEYQKTSHELECLGKSIRECIKDIHRGTTYNRFDTRSWDEIRADRRAMLEDLRTREQDAHQRLRDITARIEHTIRNEINLGKISCC